MKRSYFDITDKIGPLVALPNKFDWPMYSYDRPAYMLWNEIGAELSRNGWSDERIKDWLQSKETRWALDGSLGDKIIKLGKDYAQQILLAESVAGKKGA